MALINEMADFCCLRRLIYYFIDHRMTVYVKVLIKTVLVSFTPSWFVEVKEVQETCLTPKSKQLSQGHEM